MVDSPASALAQPVARDWHTITDLADAFQITPRAIRFYEDQGLINPERRGQQRIYSKRDYARLAWVLRGKRVGFSLAEIGELLDLYDVDSSRKAQRMKTIEKCRERISALEDQRRDIDHMLDELRDFTATLSEIIALDTSPKHAVLKHIAPIHKD